MCELYLSSAEQAHFPEDDLRHLQRHGGAPWTNLQGWGLAWWQGDMFGLEKAAQPARGAAGYDGLLRRAYASPLYLLHLRAASTGGVSRANTQPFRFDWNGTACAFLHNGELSGMKARLIERYGPDPREGGSDSEGAMILLRDALSKATDSDMAWPVFRHWAQDMRDMGIANFIVALGLDAFVHVHRRTELGGDAVDDTGLYMFRDATRLRMSSEPMSETDTTLERGTLLWIRDGRIVERGLTS